MAVEKEKLNWMYRNMLAIRNFEERVAELFAAGKCFGFCHLYAGEEAVATGVCANLRKEDYITSTHRGHGHLISKGGDLKLMMAELFGRRTGYCKGKGGSMHIADVELGILGANGIAGGGFPAAVGAGFTAKYKGTDHVVACFFGDGASNQGTFHEALNMASIWKLPVVFVNENNFYGISMSQKRSMNIPDVAARLLAEEGARCLVVLGGDGTNRAVAKGSVSVPFMSVSTGTNNIFPCMVEGTIAGMAAGFVATGLVPVEDATFPAKRLDVMIDGEAVDLALVDVALYDDIFLGSKAIWDMDRVKELVLTQAKPSNIGLSSVGGMVIDRPMPQKKGLHVLLGPSDSDEGFVVTAPVAPGLIKPVRVLEVNEVSLGEEVSFDLSPAVIALDGEREVEVLPGKKVSVRLNENGPRVVDIEMTMWLAVRNKAWSPAANEEVSFYGSSGHNA